MPIVLYKKTIKSFQFYQQSKCIKKKGCFYAEKDTSHFYQISIQKASDVFFHRVQASEYWNLVSL